MVILLFLLLCCFPLCSYAAVSSEDCHGCHDAYKGYVHAGVSCTVCHAGITDVPHAEKLPKPSCRKCHNDTVGRFSASVHDKKGISCKECHDAHFLNKGAKQCASCHREVQHRTLPSAGKHLSNLQCIACHGRVKNVHAEITLRFNEGKAIEKDQIDRDKNGLVDVAEWNALQALLESKFKGAYKFGRMYTVAGDAHQIQLKSALCKECHETRTRLNTYLLKVRDSLTYEVQLDPKAVIHDLPSLDRYPETVHGKHGVGCNDCHIDQVSIDDTACVRCHQKTYGVYDNSAHAKKGAASCKDCHNPHSIKAYKDLNAKERTAVCSRCHKDFLKKHEWLPNTSLHFNALECTTCHSPASEKSMVFFFARREGPNKVPLTFQDLAGIPGNGGMTRGFVEMKKNGIATSADIAGFFLDLQKSLGRNLLIDASIMVTKVHHDYSVKSMREKSCSLCHSEQAPFYRSMYLILPEKQGQLYLPVKGTLLSSYPLRMSLDMVLIGSDKIKRIDVDALFKLGRKERSEYMSDLGYKWIDLIGISWLLLVLLFVLLHLFLKVLVRR
jgi:predicted CXXCH cytochrome family protein